MKTQAANDRDERLERAIGSMEGLSVGDALGSYFPGHNMVVQSARATNRMLPTAPWHYTDDSEMAFSIVSLLKQHAEIVQDDLAQRFARCFNTWPTARRAKTSVRRAMSNAMIRCIAWWGGSVMAAISPRPIPRRLRCGARRIHSATMSKRSG